MPTPTEREFDALRDAYIDGWRSCQAMAAAAICQRCASEGVYSRAKYVRPDNRKERLHQMLGHPRIFKACLAGNVWNLPSPVK